jgi:hypothetical protein
MRGVLLSFVPVHARLPQAHPYSHFALRSLRLVTNSSLFSLSFIVVIID